MQLGVIPTNLNVTDQKPNMKSIPIKLNWNRNLIRCVRINILILSEMEKYELLILLSYLTEIKMIRLYYKLNNKYYQRVYIVSTIMDA